jgi:hypothetical protein
MPQRTSPPAQIVADTIARAVELRGRITNAAVAGETTVVFPAMPLRHTTCAGRPRHGN